jgi:predicted Zn-ribbon and HTH transcriptional regulator
MHFKTCVEMQCNADAKRVHKAALHLKKQSKKSGIALLFHSAKGRRNGFQIKAITLAKGLALERKSPFEGDFGDLSAATL